MLFMAKEFISVTRFHLQVSAAKKPPLQPLPFCTLTVTKDALIVETIPNKANGIAGHKWIHNVDSISYGVQDIVYTRVFSVILINEADTQNPFEVEAFVCDSRIMARKLTFALAASFQEYSRRLQEADQNNNNQDWVRDNNLPATEMKSAMKKKFAIDLRSPEEIESELQEQETDA